MPARARSGLVLPPDPGWVGLPFAVQTRHALLQSGTAWSNAVEIQLGF